MKRSDLRKIIKEEYQSIQKKQLREDLFDKFFNHIDGVLAKGRKKQALQAIDDADPEMAKKVKEYMDSEEERQEWINKTFGKKTDEEIETAFEALLKSKRK